MQHGTTLTNSQSVYRRQLLKQLSKNCCFEKEHASLLIQSNQQTGGLAKEANCQETIIIDLKFRRFLSNNLSVASAIEDRECKQIVALLFNSVADLGGMRGMRPHPPRAAPWCNEKRQISSYRKAINMTGFLYCLWACFNVFSSEEKKLKLYLFQSHRPDRVIFFNLNFFSNDG